MFQHAAGCMPVSYLAAAFDVNLCAYGLVMMFTADHQMFSNSIHVLRWVIVLHPNFLHLLKLTWALPMLTSVVPKLSRQVGAAQVNFGRETHFRFSFYK